MCVLGGGGGGGRRCTCAYEHECESMCPFLRQNQPRCPTKHFLFSLQHKKACQTKAIITHCSTVSTPTLTVTLLHPPTPHPPKKKSPPYLVVGIGLCPGIQDESSLFVGDLLVPHFHLPAKLVLPLLVHILSDRVLEPGLLQSTWHKDHWVRGG